MIPAKQRVDRRRSGRARPSGFSLIELLVSISVLGVLVMLILPSLHTVMRSTAPLIRCTSNLHQLHHAMTLYQQDSEDYLPIAGFDPLRGQSTPNLDETLSSYGGGKMSLWICPADPRPTLVQQNWGSLVYPVARLVRNNRLRIRAFDLGASYPLLADRGAFHIQSPPSQSASPMNEPVDPEEPRYVGTVNQEGYWDGHNALLAQGTITHRALAQGEEEKPRGSWWQRLTGR